MSTMREWKDCIMSMCIDSSLTDKTFIKNMDICVKQLKATRPPADKEEVCECGTSTAIDDCKCNEVCLWGSGINVLLPNCTNSKVNKKAYHLHAMKKCCYCGKEIRLI